MTDCYVLTLQAARPRSRSWTANTYCVADGEQTAYELPVGGIWRRRTRRDGSRASAAEPMTIHPDSRPSDAIHCDMTFSHGGESGDA